LRLLFASSVKSVKADEKAYLAQTAGVIKSDGGEKIDVSFFGIDKDQFLAPKIFNVLSFPAILTVSPSFRLYSSFSERSATASLSPVLYTTIGAYQEIRFETQGTSENTRINAIITRATIFNVLSFPAILTVSPSFRLYSSFSERSATASSR
jgi:putative ABC transport system permease protein